MSQQKLDFVYHLYRKEEKRLEQGDVVEPAVYDLAIYEQSMVNWYMCESTSCPCDQRANQSTSWSSLENLELANLYQTNRRKEHFNAEGSIRSYKQCILDAKKGEVHDAFWAFANEFRARADFDLIMDSVEMIESKYNCAG